VATTLSINGTDYPWPGDGDVGWGDKITDAVSALTTSTLQLKGGDFYLTAELDLGGTFGLALPYFKTKTANEASVGIIRLSNQDNICWRDLLDTSNLELVPSASSDGILTYNGVDLLTTTGVQTLSNKTLGALTGDVALSDGVVTANNIGKVSLLVHTAVKGNDSDVDTTANTNTTVPLVTADIDDLSVNLLANQFTLGIADKTCKYEFSGKVVSSDSATFASVYNVTDTSSPAQLAGKAQDTTEINGVISITGVKTFELRAFVVTGGPDTFGTAKASLNHASNVAYTREAWSWLKIKRIG
jgi:hypothetical protein